MSRFTRRRFIQGSLMGGLASILPSRSIMAAPFARPIGANDDIRLAIVGLGELGAPGVGARGRQLIDRLKDIAGVRIVALCDVDTQILEREMQRLAQWQKGVKRYTDMRSVFAAAYVDAVFIATPNHWHALATIWACQAGKDVYVEKPASHTIWEGRQMVAAARKYGRIVQVGTQSRSSDVSRQAVETIQSGQLGKILYARAIVYRRRESIGKVSGPQPAPASVDYNLWLGPAPAGPLMRRAFHYDWHWQWATGNGEIGNNGVHYLDRCRWLLGQEGLPPRARSIGGRFVFNDDGQTPNTQIALLDYEPAPLICEVRGLPEKSGSKAMDKFLKIATGVIVQCEGGWYQSDRQTSAIYANDGSEIKVLTDRRDPSVRENAHQVNFVEAMRSRKPGDLNAEILDGHRSTALCHMANLSFRLGGNSNIAGMRGATKNDSQWLDAFERFKGHLEANGIDFEKTPATLGPWISIDPTTEEFVGATAERASTLSRRKYREPFVVPDIV